MNKGEIRILEMLVRVRQYILLHIAVFPAGSPGQELHVIVDTCIKNMEKHAAMQATHTHGARQRTAQKNAADEALRNLMEAMSRTALSMSRKAPGVEETFRLPSGRDMRTWLATADAFATHAEPMAEEFIKRGMSSAFIDDLKEHARAVGQLLDGRAQQEAERVAATAGVAEAAEQGLAAVRELDAIVRNVYANNEAELTAWESASHVERAPRRAEQKAPPAEPAPAGA